MKKISDGFLTKAFAAACVTGAASVVGVGVGLTVAPVALPVAAGVLAGSAVVAGASGVTMLGRFMRDFWHY